MYFAVGSDLHRCKLESYGESQARSPARGRPWLAVEAKLGDRPLDPNLRYLLERVRIPHAVQVSLHGTLDSRLADVNGCRVRLVPAARFLAHLP